MADRRRGNRTGAGVHFWAAPRCRPRHTRHQSPWVSLAGLRRGLHRGPFVPGVLTGDPWELDSGSRCRLTPAAPSLPTKGSTLWQSYSVTAEGGVLVPATACPRGVCVCVCVCLQSPCGAQEAPPLVYLTANKEGAQHYHRCACAPCSRLRASQWCTESALGHTCVPLPAARTYARARTPQAYTHSTRLSLSHIQPLSRTSAPPPHRCKRISLVNGPAYADAHAHHNKHARTHPHTHACTYAHTHTHTHSPANHTQCTATRMLQPTHTTVGTVQRCSRHILQWMLQ